MPTGRDEFESLRYQWVDALVGVRDAIATLDRAQAAAHAAVRAADSRSADDYKDSLLDAILPLEACLRKYEMGMDGLLERALVSLKRRAALRTG